MSANAELFDSCRDGKRNDVNEKEIVMNADLIRAWKDEMYRDGLTAEQLAAMPANPAGVLELSEDELAGVDGALTPVILSLISLNTLIWSSVKWCS
jgi:mersacidin/lichenicidin family type 2 lantibiotic